MSQLTIDTKEIDYEDISDWFSKIGKIPRKFYEEKSGDLEYAKTMDGVKRFKRRLLGFCGKESVKSLDKIAQALVDIGVSSTTTEAETIAQKLVGIPLTYSNKDLGNHCLTMVPVKDSSGNQLYRLIAYFSERYP
jgi:hypothetical protein